MINRLATTISAVALVVSAFALVPAAASAAPPANDNVVDAQVIGPALPVSVAASNLEATAEPGEPAIFSNAAISTVWFKWTAPASTTVVVDLCENGFTGADNPFQTFAVRQGAGFGNVLVAEQAGECSKRFNATVGVQYKIQVDYRDNQGNFTFRLRQLAPPSNDNFASALPIGPALPINLNSSNVDSGYQAGEPAALGGSSNSRSVWYSWTAPAAGQVRMDMCDFDLISGSGNRTLIAYTGATLGTLVAVSPVGESCEVNFTAVAGTTYRIAFSGTLMGEGNLVLRLKNAPPPANDNFANATPVGPGLPVLVPGNNEFAGAQAGEPEHSGSGFPAARSVWYQWTPTESGRVRISSCSRDFNARLGVYTGAALNALTVVGNEPSYAPFCRITLDAVAGTVYRIAAAGGPQDGSYGPFNLDIHRLVVPANDDFANAKVLSLKSSGSIKGTTVDASDEDGEPSHVIAGYGDNTASVWYAWKATSRQPVILSACSTADPARLAVYTGTEVSDLDLVAASESGCPAGTKGGKVAIAPDVGVTYRIAVASSLRDFDSAFTLSAQGPFLAPKAKFNLSGAIKKCRKLGSKGKRNRCIRKVRRQAAVFKCQGVLDSTQQTACVAKARRR